MKLALLSHKKSLLFKLQVTQGKALLNIEC
jgi:hypothetical protein